MVIKSLLWLRSYRRQTVGKTAQIHRLATLATFKGGPGSSCSSSRQLFHVYR